MILSERRKRSVSSLLDNDSAFFFHSPMFSSGLSEFYDQRKSIIQMSAVEQLHTVDTCCVRATEVDC